MKKSQFYIIGMHCASCALTIEKALKKVAGVKSAVVNLVSEKAIVEYEDTVTFELLQEAVAKTGYELVAETPAFAKASTSAEASADKSASKQNEFKTLHQVAEDHAYPEEHRHKEEHDHHKLLKEAEIKLLRKKFIAGAVLSLFVILLSFPEIFVFIKGIFSEPLRLFILFLLTLPVEFWVGWQFWRGAWFGLRNLKVNMDTLVVLGTGAAFIFSTAVTVLSIVNRQLSIVNLNVYFDVAAVVTTLVLFGKYLEAKAKGAASEAIKKLIKLQAKTARIIKDGKEIDIPIEEVKAGDIVQVRPGEKFRLMESLLMGHQPLMSQWLLASLCRLIKKPATKLLALL